MLASKLDEQPEPADEKQLRIGRRKPVASINNSAPGLPALRDEKWAAARAREAPARGPKGKRRHISDNKQSIYGHRQTALPITSLTFTLLSERVCGKCRSQEGSRVLGPVRPAPRRHIFPTRRAATLGAATTNCSHSARRPTRTWSAKK